MAERIQYRQNSGHYPPMWRRPHRSRDEVELRSDRSWNKVVNRAEPVKVAFHVTAPTPSFPVDEAKFRHLVSSWRKDTAAQSSLSKKVMHPAYQRIIGMGPTALPWILKEMKRRPGHWFWALDAITQGADPAHDCRDLEEATEAWIRWGETLGLL